MDTKGRSLLLSVRETGGRTSYVTLGSAAHGQGPQRGLAVWKFWKKGKTKMWRVLGAAADLGVSTLDRRGAEGQGHSSGGPWDAVLGGLSRSW